MSQVEVSYKETLLKIIDEIQKHERVYIATSVNDNVTVRQMMLNSKGLTLWFLTARAVLQRESLHACHWSGES